MLEVKNNSEKGEVKQQVAQFTITDYEVRRIIVNSLANAGLDVILKPIGIPGTMEIRGEEITVFRKEV